MAITTDQELKDEMGRLAGQDLAKTPVDTITTKPDEDISDITLGDMPETKPVFADETALDVTVTGPSKPDLGQVADTTTVTPDIKELGGAKAEQLTPDGPYVDMTGVEGTVSEGSIAQAAQAELDPRATTQYQLGELMKSLETGGPMPPWAAPQVRKVNALMQARGLPASSMASAAVMQALMESGVQIASKDADKFATIQLANLNNRQQAAVQNAQSFLQVDMANLSNQQQTELFKAQQRTQAMFTDQAATNAARQFNATSQNQVDQFFANLANQTAQFNAAQQNAQAQFNAGQANTIERFNAEMNNQRDQFNAQNQTVIAQSNAQWRRQLATADTAAVNRANELNANAILDISKTAYNNLWQYYADSMEHAWEAADSELDRLNNLAVAQLSADATKAAQAMASSSAAGTALGGLLGTLGAAYIQFG